MNNAYRRSGLKYENDRIGTESVPVFVEILLEKQKREAAEKKETPPTQPILELEPEQINEEAEEDEEPPPLPTQSPTGIMAKINNSRVGKWFRRAAAVIALTLIPQMTHYRAPEKNKTGVSVTDDKKQSPSGIKDEGIFMPPTIDDVLTEETVAPTTIETVRKPDKKAARKIMRKRQTGTDDIAPIKFKSGLENIRVYEGNWSTPSPFVRKEKPVPMPAKINEGANIKNEGENPSVVRTVATEKNRRILQGQEPGPLEDIAPEEKTNP